jgi:hypothetical protein
VLALAVGLFLAARDGTTNPGAVRVEPPRSDPAAAAGCATLAAALPAALAPGLRRRETVPASRLTAAWGNPPVTLRCGVGIPAGYDPAGNAAQIDGVVWYPQPGPEATVYVTVTRRPRVAVAVPAGLAGFEVLAGPLSAAVAGGTRATAP